MDTIPGVQFDCAGLAAGTFLALCTDPRMRCLSRKYVNAGADLREVVAICERDPESGEGEAGQE